MSQRKSFRQLMSIICTLSANELPTKEDISWARKEILRYFFLIR